MSPTFLSLIALALAASTVMAGSNHPSRTTVRARDFSLIDPPTDSIIKPLNNLTPSETTTNARRMAAGLNPMAPRGNRHRFAPRNPTPSGTPPCHSGYLSVVDSTGSTLGYLSPSLTAVGHYGSFTPDIDSALKVSFTPAPSGFDMTAVNGVMSDLPFVGGTTSNGQDLGPGADNFIYIGPTSQTPASSPPVSGPNAYTVATGNQKDIESSIWKLDDSTLIVSPQWVNSDNSLPVTHIMYVPADQSLVLVGDPQAFQNSFGPATEVTFHGVSA